MIEDRCRKWLRYSFETIASVPDCRLPPGDMPVDELEQLGAVPLVYWSIQHNGHKPTTTHTTLLLSIRLHNALKKRELYDICSALESKDVDYRLLKGHSAWLHLYGGREEIRPLSDSDILVNPKHYEVAITAIEELGYYSDSDASIRRASRTANQFTFSQQFGQFTNAIDLHRFPHNWPLHHKLGEVALQACHRCRIQSLFTLDKQLALLWIASHRAKDRYEGDLREVLDAKLFLNSMCSKELELMSQLIETLKFEQYTLRLLLQARHWFGEAPVASNEARLLAKLTLESPNAAIEGERQLAGIVPGYAKAQSLSATRNKGHWELLHYYRESLCTPGHRTDAVISMLHYAFARFRRIISKRLNLE